MFFTYKKLTDRDYRLNFRDYPDGKNHKPKETVKKELSMIKGFWKCDPMHYYRYRLYEKDLSYDELIDYIPPYYFYNYHMPLVINAATLPITESKILLHEYLLSKKIETPVTVAIVKKGRIFNLSGVLLTLNEFSEKINASGSSLFFVKPAGGKGGKGIFTIRKNDDELYINNSPYDEKTFSNLIVNNDFIVQEALIQRSDISSINPTSVNTLRVITQFEGGEYKISAVVLRIGRKGSFVDNSAQGGISVNVDTESGNLNRYAYTEHTNERFERHPDTGFIFGGFIINKWSLIRQEILEYAGEATEFREVAWDIAVLEDRISVIELNLNYGIDHLQCCIGGMRRKLNINPSYTV
jgi:hypothetical protein